MFELATRKKYRFDSKKGLISTEDLWDVPLTAHDGFDLNNIAKKISKELKESSEEEFVKPATTGNQLLEAKLEIVKHIIAVKIEERDAREKAEEKRAQKQRLMELIERKKEADLEGKSLEELQKLMDEL